MIEIIDKLVKEYQDENNGNIKYYTYYCVAKQNTAPVMVYTITFECAYKEQGSIDITYHFDNYTFLNQLGGNNYLRYLPTEKETISNPMNFYCPHCGARICFTFSQILLKNYVKAYYSSPVRLCDTCGGLILQHSPISIAHKQISYMGKKFDDFFSNPFQELIDTKIGDTVPFGRYDFIVTDCDGEDITLITKNVVTLDEIDCFKDLKPQSVHHILSELNSPAFLYQNFSKYENSVMEKNILIRNPTSIEDNLAPGIGYYKTISEIDQSEPNEKLCGGVFLMPTYYIDKGIYSGTYFGYDENGETNKNVILDRGAGTRRDSISKMYNINSTSNSPLWISFNKIKITDWNDFGFKLIIKISYSAINNFKFKLDQELLKQ